MDARLQFEWNGDKAKNVVASLFRDKHLAEELNDIVERDDAEYEVGLVVKLRHKRKSRKKKESIGLDG